LKERGGVRAGDGDEGAVRQQGDGHGRLILRRRERSGVPDRGSGR
jgi:hypothetical protein